MNLSFNKKYWRYRVRWSMWKIRRANSMRHHSQMLIWVKIQTICLVFSKVCHISACILMSWQSTLGNRFLYLMTKMTPWQEKRVQNNKIWIIHSSVHRPATLMKFQNTRLFLKNRRKREMKIKRATYWWNNWLNRSKLRNTSLIG